MAKYAFSAMVAYIFILALDQQVIANFRGARNLNLSGEIPSYWLTLVSRLLLMVWMSTSPLAALAMRHQSVAVRV